MICIIISSYIYFYASYYYHICLNRCYNIEINQINVQRLILWTWLLFWFLSLMVYSPSVLYLFLIIIANGATSVFAQQNTSAPNSDNNFNTTNGKDVPLDYLMLSLWWGGSICTERCIMPRYPPKHIVYLLYNNCEWYTHTFNSNLDDFTIRMYAICNHYSSNLLVDRWSMAHGCFQCHSSFVLPGSWAGY